MALALVTTCIFSLLLAAADPLPSSSPHTYPGKPPGDYSPLWQNYFHINQKLPNVTSNALGPRTFAGNIATQRAGHPNDTLFFVGVENTLGSLTKPAKPAQNEPWGIFLNGGPGSSSMLGFFFENGPIHIQGDYSAVQNKYSWDKLADWLWIDQPVGVGYSTADSNGYALDEDQIATDFMGFLGNLVKVFPSLASRPLHLTGESYAGTYIPYIMKAYFSMTNPPVKIAKVALGNPTISDAQSFQVSAVMSIIETYPQFIGYDEEVYNYFKEQFHLCGLDVNLTYPQNGVIAPLQEIHPTGRVFPSTGSGQAARSKLNQLARRSYPTENLLARRDRDNAQALWKRNLSGRGNGTIDSWYGCFLYDELLDYAVNFTYPWNDILTVDVYNVPDALNPEVNLDASVFLNDNRTRAALHAPDIAWSPFSPFPFGNPDGLGEFQLSYAITHNNVRNSGVDPSPVPMTFFNEFAKNASIHNIGVVLYSGNDDSLIAHRGTEIAIQNTTFGGIQGFTRKPSTPWTNDAGQFAGVIHQERNWTYVLFNKAAHQVPMSQPASAFTFLRDFVLGKKTTGLVQTSGGKTTVVGGEDSTLAPILRGGDEIYLGSGTTQSTYFYPTATRAAWQSFIQTATATISPTRTPHSAKFVIS